MPPAGSTEIKSAEVVDASGHFNNKKTFIKRKKKKS